MANKAKKEPIFTVLIALTLTPIKHLFVPLGYNESRSGTDSLAELLGLKVDKNGNVSVNKETSEILASMLSDRGFDSTEKMISTKVGVSKATQKADAIKFRKELKAQLAELAKIPLFKGETGKFPYKGKEVSLVHDDIVKEWALTFTPKIGKADRFDSPRCQPILSGSRRLTLLVIRNAIVRKAGHAEDVISEIPVEQRGYTTARRRQDDSVYLNEAGKRGKLESTKLQKLRASFRKVESGAAQGDLAAMFATDAGTRGKVQQYWAIVTAVRFPGWITSKLTYCGEELTGSEVAKRMKADLLDGSTPMPKQGKQLKRLNSMRNCCEHSDGHMASFAEKGPGTRREYGVNPKTRLTIAESKVHVRDHPELVQEIVTWFTNIRDKEWVDPRDAEDPTTSSMSSASIMAVAANCSDSPGGKLTETLLNTAAGGETGYDLSDVAKVLETFAPAVFLRDSDGKLTGNPIDQKTLDGIAKKAEKKASRRNRRA